MTGVSGRSGVSQDDGSNLITANQKSVFSAGTVFTLTDSAAAVTFGTTSPAITLDKPGTYLITARARFENVGATFAATRPITLKLRRTNNTASDITNGTIVYNTPVITSLTSTLTERNITTIYTTTNSDDAIALYSHVGTLPSAGTVTIDEASIVAFRLQQ